MPDTTYLSWPFLEDKHRDHATHLRAWAEETAPTIPHDDVDAACQTWVKKLGEGGWLEPSVSMTGKLDVRTLCLTRETLAFFDGSS